MQRWLGGTATVSSVNALPDPITTSEETIYRVSTSTGDFRFFRVIANAWIEANTTPVFIVPTASQFVSAFIDIQLKKVNRSWIGVVVHT